MWDLTTAKRLPGIRLAQGLRVAGNLSFSGDGKSLVTERSSEQGNLELWEVATGKLRYSLTGHSKLVLCSTLSADGRTVSSAGQDGTMRVWDLSRLVRKEKPAAPKYTEAELDALWTDLGSVGASDAYRAIWDLNAAPQQAVPLLRERLCAAPERPIDEPMFRRRWARGIEALELLGSDASREALTRLAQAPPEMQLLRDDARRALRRLAERFPVAP